MNVNFAHSSPARRVVLATAALLAMGLAPMAHAVAVTWVLQDVVFDDGGTAFGSFVYDADTNTFSAINVTTTDGSALAGSVYQFANFEAGVLDADSVLLVAAANPGSGTPAFNMNLDEAMTNAGGTISLAMAPPPLAFESTCLTSVCDSFFSIDRVIVSGSITAVPVPAAVWLMGSALGLLGGLGRRRTGRGLKSV
ncbi:MAG: hypothetical protein AAFU65_04300 [Pseudomonadota bacterium]